MKHQSLIFIDRLAKPLYIVLNQLKWRPKKIDGKQKLIILKFFGLGSITRIAHVMRVTDIPKKEVIFITLSKNEAIIELLHLNALYIKSGNPFQFITSTISVIGKVWQLKNTHILDMERASNLSGIFRLVLGTNKACSSFYFKDKNSHRPSQNFISLTNKAATKAIAEMFGKKYCENLYSAENSIEANKVLININAGNYLPQRKFTLPEYAQLIEALHRKKPNWKFYLTGSKSEVPFIESFMALLLENKIPKTQIIILAGQQNLPEFINDVKTAELFITNDSGPLHLAYYFGANTVGIWGPTSHELVGYKDNRKMLNIRSGIACSPCFIHPKSQVAKACNGELTCFKSSAPSNMALKILKFASTAYNGSMK